MSTPNLSNCQLQCNHPTVNITSDGQTTQETRAPLLKHQSATIAKKVSLPTPLVSKEEANSPTLLILSPTLTLERFRKKIEKAKLTLYTEPPLLDYAPQSWLEMDERGNKGRPVEVILNHPAYLALLVKEGLNQSLSTYGNNL